MIDITILQEGIEHLKELIRFEKTKDNPNKELIRSHEIQIYRAKETLKCLK